MQARIGCQAVERLGALLLVGEDARLGDLLEVDLLLHGYLVRHNRLELDKALGAAGLCRGGRRSLLLLLLLGLGGCRCCCRL